MIEDVPKTVEIDFNPVKVALEKKVTGEYELGLW